MPPVPYRYTNTYIALYKRWVGQIQTWPGMPYSHWNCSNNRTRPLTANSWHEYCRLGRWTFIPARICSTKQHLHGLTSGHRTGLGKEARLAYCAHTHSWNFYSIVPLFHYSLFCVFQCPRGHSFPLVSRQPVKPLQHMGVTYLQNYTPRIGQA